jgi:hypothetical protein
MRVMKALCAQIHVLWRYATCQKFESRTTPAVHTRSVKVIVLTHNFESSVRALSCRELQSKCSSKCEGERYDESGWVQMLCI